LPGDMHDEQLKLKKRCDDQHAETGCQEAVS